MRFRQAMKKAIAENCNRFFALGGPVFGPLSVGRARLSGDVWRTVPLCRAGFRPSVRRRQFAKVSPSEAASMRMGFVRSMSPAKMRFDSSFTMTR